MQHVDVVIDCLSITVMNLREHIHYLEQELDSSRDEVLKLKFELGELQRERK